MCLGLVIVLNRNFLQPGTRSILENHLGDDNKPADGRDCITTEPADYCVSEGEYLVIKTESSQYHLGRG